MQSYCQTIDSLKCISFSLGVHIYIDANSSNALIVTSLKLFVSLSQSLLFLSLFSYMFISSSHLNN